MKIYYHICLTGYNDQADLLSLGVAASNEVSAYFEINDYDQYKIDKQADRDVVSEFLGRRGMEDLIVARPKTKGFICSGIQAKQHLNDFLLPHNEIGLVGYSGIYEAAAMIQLFNENNFSKHVHLVNLETEILTQNKDLFGDVAPELPENNALRCALFYKEISRRYGT